jgi:hypothetical protein
MTLILANVTFRVYDDSCVISIKQRSLVYFCIRFCNCKTKGFAIQGVFYHLNHVVCYRGHFCQFLNCDSVWFQSIVVLRCWLCQNLSETIVSNVMYVYWFITFDICAFSYIPIGKRVFKHLLEHTHSPFTYPIQFTELALTIPVNK